LPNFSRFPDDLRNFVDRWNDKELLDIFQNLGGHDFAVLRNAFSEADRAGQPSVVFAYTLKGWRLPVVGDPQNHSVVLSQNDMDQVRDTLGVGEDEIWSGFDSERPEGQFCIETGRRLRSISRPKASSDKMGVPPSLGHTYRNTMSTQQAFGQILTDIAWGLPAVADRIVTVSPDVASSTNLGGWINRVGVWSQKEREHLPDDGVARTLRWDESPQGQHIELGISENNLFMLLGQLGLAYEMSGEMVFPIGTLYDPFVCRALEACLYNTYVGSHFMVTGTPSGITLSREGGAHQSVITPSIGIELPDITFYEPCFVQELEWIVLHGLEQIRLRKGSFYLRLTTRRIDQRLLQVPEDASQREHLRKQVLEGAYRLIDRSMEPEYQPGENVVNIFASGVMIPEAVEASHLVRKEGVFANVINVTSSDILFRRFQESVSGAMAGHSGPATGPEHMLSPSERTIPVVTVLDGHPHTLAWIGSALGARAFPLGVSQFGQSGARDDLYMEHQIDVNSIMMACFAALEAGVA
jgi:pyruvate dehydrogenase E1 component